MFKRICARAGCSCAIDYSERWCERHRDSEPKRIQEQDRGRHRYSEASPEKRVASRLYASAAWQAMRLAQLRGEPLCRHCADQQRVTAATVVDHIQRHGNDIGIFYDRTNLQSLCKPCHDRKTAGEDAAERKAAGLAADGWRS